MKRISLVLALLLCVGSVQAATVYLEPVPTGAGTWDLTCWIEGGSAGLAGFNIDLVGIGSATVVAPYAISGPPSYTPSGFTLGGGSITGDGAIFAGQNTTNADSLVYDIGVAAGTFDFLPGTATQVPWDLPVVLAEITAAATPDHGPSLNANVFQEEGSVATEEAEVVWVPEPATMSLLALGGLAALRRRR